MTMSDLGSGSTAVIDASSITAIDHNEAMALAATATARLLEVVDQLDASDWTTPTDCAGWDVKAMLSHVLGLMEANARTLEFARQFILASRGAKRSGGPMVDEMTARQVREHASLSPEQLTRKIHEAAPRAVRGRTRMPALVRGLSLPSAATAPFGRWTIGYLVDVIENRDSFMHRIDITRATGKKLVLSADHDGRIVANIVAEWAATHGQPFRLELEGDAGGNFYQGNGGEQVKMDAVEFCRILSGRGTGSGLIATEIPF